MSLPPDWIPTEPHHERFVDMAEKVLRLWAVSDDEPVGSLWDLYCDLYGVDPETFADGVRYERRKKAA